MKKILCIVCFSVMTAILLLGASSGNETFTVKGDGEARDMAVAYPEYANGLIKEYAEVFAQRLSEATGNSVVAASVSELLSSEPYFTVYIGEEYDGTFYVGYLAEKNGGLVPFMPGTEKEWDLFCGVASTYSLFVDETGLHINASDEWALYWAIDTLLKDIEGSEVFSLNVGMKSFVGEEYVFPDPTEFIGKGVAPYFAVTELVAELPEYLDYVNIKDYSDSLQGGGTDGEFAYIGGDGSGDLGRIYKYSLPEWELVAVSEPILIKHANAISYIAESNLLTVAHCTDSDVRGFAYVDPNTLEVVDYGQTPVDCWGLEYDNGKERFIVEVNWMHYVFDKDFNLITELSYGDNDGVPQTLFVDGEYIYDVRYNVYWDTGHSKSTPDPREGQNYITVHDYENVYIEKAPVPVLVGEVEHMFRHGNMYYIGYIGNIIDRKQMPYGMIYEFVMLPEIWWAQ